MMEKGYKTGRFHTSVAINGADTRGAPSPRWYLRRAPDRDAGPRAPGSLLQRESPNQKSRVVPAVRERCHRVSFGALTQPLIKIAMHDSGS